MGLLLSSGARPDDALGLLDEEAEMLGRLVAGAYRVEALVARGGVGSIYRAEQVGADRKVALKVLRRELSAVDEVRERFARETLACIHVAHPNVALGLGAGTLPEGAPFLVLEYLEGQDLRAALAEGPLPPARATRIGAQCARALGAAHRVGVVHRDLKPENLMLVRRGDEADFVKVLDFGMAKVPVAELAPEWPPARPVTLVGMAYGTPEYMAPEQARGEPVDGRADLYALGVLLYEMLSGTRPFSAPSRAGLQRLVATREAPPLGARAKEAGLEVPPALEAAVARLLALGPEERYASADAAASALDAALG